MGAFGQTVETLLSERAMSQAELGRRLGISAQAVSSWLRGGIIPTRENVERVEDELSVEPRGYLLQIAGYSTDGPPEPTVESLIRADPGLDPEDKRVILRILRLARERHPQPQ